MMRRFAYDLEDIVTHASMDDTDMLLLEHINGLNSTLPLPNQTDVLEVTESLIRLYNVYDLTAKDLINGFIANKTTSVGLTKLQAFEIGKHALVLEMYPQALDWLQTVQREIQITEREVDVAEVRKEIRQLILKHDSFHDNITEENFYSVNMNRFDAKIASNYSLVTEKTSQKQRDWRYISEEFAFTALCKGDSFQTDAEKSKLYCYYETKSHPFWAINPLKIEILNWNPYLIHIYDAISESLIEYLMATATPELERATVGSQDATNINAYQVSSSRTSTHAFLPEEKYPRLSKITKLIELVTNLVVENNFIFNETSGPKWNEEYASEWIQVAAYTFGGHFSEHIDAMENGINETAGGDRIATFMIYLNDVEFGGQTAFVDIGIAVTPVKGSALFWYNLKKNGDADDTTVHGGCPVILGKKWVANTWIHYNSNFLKRKCSLDPSE